MFGLLFRNKVNRRMAATRSLSQSEPDIPAHYTEETMAQCYDDDGDDDVIGFTERLGDSSKDMVDHRKPSPKPKEDKQPKQTEKPQETPPPPTPSIPKQKPVVVEDFPSLPGTKSYLPHKNMPKKTEDFPALPMAAAAVKTKPVGTGWSNQKKEITHINGVIVKSVKSKKKGKAKQIKQPDASDFPALGQQPQTKQETVSKPPPPPPSKFNNFIQDTSNKNKDNKSNKKVKNPTPVVDTPSSATPVVKKTNQAQRAPPGFQSAPTKSTPSSAPPGFNGNNVQAKRAPPPGLQTQQTSNTNNTKERNIRLVEMLQQFLDAANLSTFQRLIRAIPA